MSLKDGVAYIRLRSLEPGGKPFDNYYEHGWREGTERISAFLVLRVLRFKPGAVVEMRNIVVE